MGIFNRSIPTYTVDTANKLRVTTPLPEEEPNTYIDDAFDPILNQAVRDRLLKQWGNPISATLAGYYEMLDNAFVGSTKQWGALGPGMGVLGAFGRTMDKGGDAIIGTLTEGVKGLTGQGVESPFHNIFVKDDDYTGGKLLAAMGNSMAKMAGAPELTEEDFGGLWNIPSIGLELATDPGIMGGAMAKAGGAVGKLSTSEVLQNLGKSGRSPLADVGQLLSNYDDAMSKIALDVTAPGTRVAIGKAWHKIEQLTKHNSPKNLVDMELDPTVPPDVKMQAFDDFQHDAMAQTAVQMAAKLDAAEEAAKLRKHYAQFANTLPLAERQQFVDDYKALQQYFNTDEPLSYADRLIDSAENDVPEAWRKYYDYLDFRTPSSTSLGDPYADMLRSSAYASNPEYIKALDEHSAFNRHNYGKTRKAYDRLKALLNRSAAQRAKDSELLKKVDAMNVHEVPDAILELENITYKAPGSKLATSKPEGGASMLTPEFVSVLRQMPGEDLRRALRRLNIKKSEWDARVLEFAENHKQLSKLKNDLDNAVTSQNEELRKLVESKFVDMPTRTDYYTLDDEYESLSTLYDDSSVTNVDAKVDELGYGSEEAIGAADSELNEYLRSKHNSIYSAVHYISRNTSRKQRTKLRKLFGISPEDYERALKELRDLPERVRKGEFKPKENPGDFALLNSIQEDRELYDFFDDIGIKIGGTSRSRHTKNAPFTISPSEHRLVNNPNIAVNAVRYAENSLLNHLKYYGRPFKGKPEDVWKWLNKNPIFRQAYIAGYDYKVITEDLRKMFKAKTGRELTIDFNDPNIKQQVLAFIVNNPDVARHTRGSYVNVKGLKDALFGKWDSKAESYTYQNQAVALDQLTYTLEHTLAPVFEAEYNSNYLTAAIKDFITSIDGDGKITIDPDKVFMPQTWYTKELHDALHARINAGLVPEGELPEELSAVQRLAYLPKGYREAINVIKNAGMRALGGTEVEAMYRWAKQMQDEVFLPIRNRGRAKFSDYKNKGVHITVSESNSDAATELSDYDRFGVGTDNSDSFILNGASIRRHTADNLKVTNEVYSFDTNALNKAIRQNAHKFPDIGSIKEFAKGLDLGFEIKLKDAVGVKLNGSQVPSLAAKFLKKYTPEQIVSNKLSGDMFTLKRFVCDVTLEPAVNKSGKKYTKHVYTINPERFKILEDISKASPDTDISTFFRKPITDDRWTSKSGSGYTLASEGTAPDEVLSYKLDSLFTDIDFAPTFVSPTNLERKKTLINAFYTDKPTVVKSDTTSPLKNSDEIADENVKQAMSNVDPRVNAETVATPPTTVDAAKQAAHEAAGTADVFEDAQRISDEVGGTPEDLPPEGREKLTLLYGKDKVMLSDVVNKAFVSNQHAKYDKDVLITETSAGRRLANQSVELSKDKHASKKLEMYDAVQTAMYGDSLKASKMLDEIVTSGGYVGIRFDSSETSAVTALRAQLQKYATYVNDTLGTNVLKVYDSMDTTGTYLKIGLDASNYKKILKADFKKLKFTDDDVIVFEAPRALTADEVAFKNSEDYAKYDEYAKGLTSYQQDIYRRLGFVYDNPVHVKHVKDDVGAANHIASTMSKDADSYEVKELAKRLLNSDAFKHNYGTFGTSPFGRGFRGSNSRYNFGNYHTFEFDPVRVLNSTFAEGTLSNTDVQNFVGLFMNDNYKLQTFFSTPEQVESLLLAKGPDGTVGGNMANLDIVAPVYDASGKIIKFKTYDKTTRSGISNALADSDAILVPSHLVASLDVWCKKNAKMSSKIYRFFNKYLSIPYKFGVLTNPGFLLGNFGDAYLKQATTLSEKYGTSVAEELALVAESLREIHYLNNSADIVYDKYLSFLKEHKIKIPPSEYPMTALNINPKARKRFVDWLNGKMVVKGKEVKIEDFLKPEEYDSARLWLYINSNQPTKSFGEGWRDLSKEDIDLESNNLIDRIFYGKGKNKFKWRDPRTWGLILNNPVSKATLGASEMMEAYFRSANVLNALKHEGYDAAGLAKILGGGYDAEVAKKLHVDTVNAMNVMYNSNFNYEAQSELMDKLGYAIPFPTFFIKNFAYWMDLLVNNPEYIDSAITIQEGLWNDRDEEVAEDKFMAEAKGRGAIPISDGDERGLSKFFRGIYKPTPLNSMFSAFNLLNHPIENLTNRVHPLISTPMQLAQAEMGEHSIGLATPEDAESVKYRPYSFNQFERNVKYSDENFNPLQFMFHKLNPFDRSIGSVMRFPHKAINSDVQLSDIVPSVFQPDF